MSGVGEGSGGDMVVQELAEVRVKIGKLEKAIEVEEDKEERLLDKQRLVELQKKENRLAERQEREQQQQQPQTGECCASRLSSLFPVTVQGGPCGEFVTCVSLLTAVLCFVRFQFVHQGRPQSGASSHR